LFKHCLAIVVLICAASAEAQVTLTKGTNFSVDVRHDGQMVIDLLGKIWIIPANGGAAKAVTGGEHAARRPRWSPDGTSIVYQLSDNNQQQLWLYRVDEGTSSNISDGQFYDHQPSWHPDGQRIVYSTDRRDSGFDLWEIDLPTGLTWRISDTPGDESEPAWSADGQDLAYISRNAGQWSLMLRRLGQPDRVLQTSATRLSNPAWRPDGSLITVMRHAPEGLAVDMVILSDPLLIRPFLTDEDFFITPVAWRDRHQLLYTANGRIRTRLFNSWTSSNIPFRASVNQQAPVSSIVTQRSLPVINAAKDQLVVRSARLFDGMGGGYREGMDIVIDDGRISAIDSYRDRPGAIVIDMGDLTLLPGFIDADARLPAEVDETLGPVLLSFGVTTIVADTDQAEILSLRWSGKEMPGPRVLGSDWLLKLDSAASLALGAESLPTSPQGIRYEDARLSNSGERTAVLSGLADARTNGLAELLQSRQAELLRGQPTALRRFVEAPLLAAQSSSIVLGSKANGLPPGIALHAEFRALADAGLDQEHVLRTAGINAAKALGLGLQTGRIAVGSSADLVLVDGDPLADVRDALKIVGVIRNGRFFSTIGLIERSTQP
jgi:hypothetical protein